MSLARYPPGPGSGPPRGVSPGALRKAAPGTRRTSRSGNRSRRTRSSALRSALDDHHVDDRLLARPARRDAADREAALFATLLAVAPTIGDRLGSSLGRSDDDRGPLLFQRTALEAVSGRSTHAHRTWVHD